MRKRESSVTEVEFFLKNKRKEGNSKRTVGFEFVGEKRNN